MDGDLNQALCRLGFFDGRKSIDDILALANSRPDAFKLIIRRLRAELKRIGRNRQSKYLARR